MLPLLFEEQLALEAEQVRRVLEQGAGSLSAALVQLEANLTRQLVQVAPTA